MVVPVIRNCEHLSFADVEKQIAEYGEKAKTGKLSVEEMTGLFLLLVVVVVVVVVGGVVGGSGGGDGDSG